MQQYRFTGECDDEYFFRPSVCTIPECSDDVRCRTVAETTREVCRVLCSTTYSLTCSSVLYDRHNRSCMLSPYTGDEIPSGTLCQDKELEFYRRKRCTSE